MLLNPDRHWWLIPASLVAAFLWQFWPLPPTLRQITPDAIVAITLYWAMQHPERLSGGRAFLLGLLRDSAEGTPLGAHALAMVLVVYLVQLASERMRLLAIWQQSIAIGMLYVFYLLVGNWASILTTNAGNTPSLFLVPALTTGLCWPVCYLLLRILEQGFSRSPVRP